MHTQVQTLCMNKLLAKSQDQAYVFIPLVVQPAMSYLGLHMFVSEMLLMCRFRSVGLGKAREPSFFFLTYPLL